MTDPEETLANLNRLIAHEPNNARLIAQRGEYYRQWGCYEEALADFSWAVALNPTYLWAIAHRGESYRHLKRFDVALTDFTRALELAPTYIWAIAHRGAIYWQRRQLNAAMVDLNHAIYLKPDYVWAIAYRVQVYIAMKRYAEALLDVDRAIALDHTIVPHWCGERGLLLNYLGRYPETIESCSQALQENPHDAIALYSLAVASALSKGVAQAGIEIGKARQALESRVKTEESGLVLYRLGGLAALEGKTSVALAYLHAASTYSDEPHELARHDPAWRALDIECAQERSH